MLPLLLFLNFLLSASALNDNAFPENFKFGVATAAYQIEGGWDADGKGENTWDHYTHYFPDSIADKSNGDVACDSYHKYKEDIELLKELGVSVYRFSLSWSRILPQGTANYVNQAGVDYYLNLLKLLNESGIEPLVTLYHWDIPQPLQDLGGWSNPLMVNYFADYATVAFELFGDYVKMWATFNEPQSFCLMGYINNEYSHFAPGYDLEAEGSYLCSATILKAHAKAYHIYDEQFRDKQNGKVSIVLVVNWNEPATDSADDMKAQELGLQFGMGIYANPIYVGNWPQLMIDRVANRSKLEGYSKSRLPEFTEEEIKYIKGTSDFFCLNHYTTDLVSYAYEDDMIGVNSSYTLDKGITTSYNSSWKEAQVSTWNHMVPWGLRKMINWVDQNYGHPEIFITENGWADDGSSLDDPDRIEYTEGYLSSVLDAIYEDNVNVVGYTHWSLMDNFEWSFGYTSKFGMVSVDFKSENRTRTPKSSYYWYKCIIEARSLADDCAVPSESSGRSLATNVFAVIISVILAIYYL
ncbi:myrosinase 1-like [Cylas formicarius]|uniref:myrosinase 1-like n=1 Tax=Cylas formicarius TaxID=197179 RepID=UPI00295879F7|nr:myrosinase 1-like [Cylas formicarius]